jgi:hypothetical protein
MSVKIICLINSRTLKYKCARSQNTESHILQSVTNNLIIQRQINQLFTEVISIWRDTDIKKNEAVRRLAARLEEYYLQQNQPQEIQNISSQIAKKLRENGLEKTADHVYDFLEDKYKRSYDIRPPTNPIDGDILPDHILEHYYTLNPLEIDHKDKINIVDTLKKKLDAREKQAQQEEHLAKSILEAAQVQNQAMDYDVDTFTSTTGQNYDHTRTDNPKREYDGPVHQAWDEYFKSVDRYRNSVKAILDDWKDWGIFDTPEEKSMERQLCRAINFETEFFETWNNAHSHFKDLKFGTSTRNWWIILMKFIDHGKHAAAVMDPILSHRYPNQKRPYTREQVGDEVYLKEQLLEKYGENRDFCDYIKAYFIDDPQRLYDKDETVLSIRKEYIGKLISLYANRKDFFEYACKFREKEMDPRIATRRIDAKETLSKLA